MLRRHKKRVFATEARLTAHFQETVLFGTLIAIVAGIPVWCIVGQWREDFAYCVVAFAAGVTALRFAFQMLASSNERQNRLDGFEMAQEITDPARKDAVIAELALRTAVSRAGRDNSSSENSGLSDQSGHRISRSLSARMSPVVPPIAALVQLILWVSQSLRN